MKIMITNESKYRPNRKHYEQGWDDLLYMENGDLARLRLYVESEDPKPIPSNHPSKPLTWPSAKCPDCGNLVEGQDADELDRKTQRCPTEFPGCGRKWCHSHKPEFHLLPGEESEVCLYCYEDLS